MAGGLREFKEGWPVVLASLVCMGTGINYLAYMSVGVFAPHLVADFGWNYSQIMGGVLLMSLSWFVSAPLVGLLSDRFGVRRVVLVGLVLFSLTFAAQGLNPGNIWAYYGLWIAFSVVGVTTAHVTFSRAVSSWFDKQRGLALGLAMMSGIFAPVVKLLAVWGIEQFGVRGGYLVLALLPLCIGFPMALLFFRERPASVAGAGQTNARPPATGLTLKEAVRTWRYWLMMAAFVPIFFAASATIPNAENMLLKHGFSMVDAVTIASFIAFAGFAVRPVIGVLMDRFWAPAVATAVLSLSAITGLIMSQDQVSYGEAILAISATGASGAGMFSASAFLVSRYFGMKNFGAIYGTIYGTAAVAGGAGPLYFGWVVDQTGSYDTALRSLIILAPLGASLLLALGRYPQAKVEPKSAAVVGSPATDPV